MTITQLAPYMADSTARQGHAPTLPEVSSLAELAPYLTRRLTRCRRSGEQLSMLWIEVDPLPTPRDAAPQAHLAELMRTASLRMRNRVRGTDEVVQVGQVGFAVLLPGAGASEAALVAHRLRRTLTGAYELEGRLAYLAVAMGEAVYPECGPSGTDLAQAARRSLALRQGS